MAPVDSQESLDLTIGSDDGSSTVRRKTNAKNAIPPLERELNDSFSDFYTESAGVLEIKELPSALIQVLNVMAPPHLVEAALLSVAPQLLQEPGSVVEGDVVMAIPEAQAHATGTAIGADGAGTSLSQASVQLVSAPVSHVSRQSQMGSQQSQADQAAAAAPTSIVSAVAAVQGLTKTEFVTIYHEVVRLMQQEEEAAARAMQMRTPGMYTPGDEGYATEAGAAAAFGEEDNGMINGMPRSQSEPAHLAVSQTEAGDGFLGEPSQVSAWAAMEQGSLLEAQAATVANNGSGSHANGQESGSGSNAVGGSQNSLERLSKTAPGKAQNPNQHWFPETEDILKDSPTKINKGGTLPQGSALEAARKKNQ